jgi:hypothetical protein
VPKGSPKGKSRRKVKAPEREGRGSQLDPKRLADVEELLAAGAPKITIRRQLGERWGLSESMLRYYIAEVERRWAEEATTEDRMRRRNAMRQRLERLRYKASRTQAADGIVLPPDYQTVLRCEEYLAKLDGVFEPDVVHHTGKVAAEIVTLPAEVRREQLDFLIARYQELRGGGKTDG